MENLITKNEVIIKALKTGTTRNGDKFFKVLLEDCNGQAWASCFDCSLMKDISAGDVVNVVLKTEGSYINIVGIEKAVTINEEIVEETVDETVDTVGTADDTNSMDCTTIKEGTDSECTVKNPWTVQDYSTKTLQDATMPDYTKTVTTNTDCTTSCNTSDIQVKHDGSKITEVKVKRYCNKPSDIMSLNDMFKYVNHARGISKMEVLKVDIDNAAKSCNVHARITLKDGTTIENIGSTSMSNVREGMAKHYIEVAVTRAFARCFRLLV